MKKLIALLCLAMIPLVLHAQAAGSSTGIVTVGHEVDFTAKCDGPGPFTYAWTFLATGSTTPKVLTPLATDPQTFIIPAVQLTDVGVYSCTIKNAGGQATGLATVTVLPVGPSNVSITIIIK